MAFMFWRTRGRDVLARTDDWFGEARSLVGLTLGCGSAWTPQGGSAASRVEPRWHRRGGRAGPRPHEDDARAEKARHPRSAVDAATADDLGRSQKAKKKRVRKKKSDVFTNTVPSIPEGFETWKGVREAIREKARDLNLGPTTFAACEPPRAERMRAYEDWLAKNMEGEMAYLARDDRCVRALGALDATRETPSFSQKLCGPFAPLSPSLSLELPVSSFRKLTRRRLFVWIPCGLSLLCPCQTREEEGSFHCVGWRQDHHRELPLLLARQVGVPLGETREPTSGRRDHNRPGRRKRVEGKGLGLRLGGRLPRHHGREAPRPGKVRGRPLRRELEVGPPVSLPLSLSLPLSTDLCSLE